jgi:hypothetical protein
MTERRLATGSIAIGILALTLLIGFWAWKGRAVGEHESGRHNPPNQNLPGSSVGDSGTPTSAPSTNTATADSNPNKVTVSVWFDPKDSVATTALSVLDDKGNVEWSNDYIDIWRHLESKGPPLEVKANSGLKTLIFIDEAGAPQYQEANFQSGSKFVLRRPKSPYRNVKVDVRDSSNRNFRRATIRIEMSRKLPSVVKPEQDPGQVLARYKATAGGGTGEDFELVEQNYRWLRSGVFQIEFVAVPSKLSLILPEVLSDVTSLVVVVDKKEYPFTFSWTDPNVFKLPLDAKQVDKDEPSD